MTLDLIVWAPEAFLTFSLLVFLWYGSGTSISPIIESIYFVNIKNSSMLNKQNIYPQLSESQQPIFSNNKNYEYLETVDGVQSHNALQKKQKMRIAGPDHISTHLNSWAMSVCFLTALLVWNTPLLSLQGGGLFLRDQFVIKLQTFLWIFQILCLAVSHSWQKCSGIIHLEYTYLILFFLLGAHLLTMSADLISLYGSLELQSFSVVVLCSLNYSSAYAIEAQIKYFLLSAFSSSLLLLGIGLIYWQTGLTRLSSLQELLTYTTNDFQSITKVDSNEFNYQISSLENMTKMGDLSIWLGLWLIGLSLLWKLAQAPLHMWAADVYMGAWSSVTLLLSTIPKIAVLGFWAHYFSPLWSAAFGGAMVFFSGMSLMIGAVAPLAQSMLKRLLQYSSVGHMGFLLMPFAQAGTSYAYSALWSHMFFYTCTSLIVWALIQQPFQRLSTTGTPSRQSGPQYIWDLVSLNKTNPTAQLAWAIQILSLAGLPPVAGFLGKLFLFWASLSQDQYLLVLLALISTLLGCVYYLRVLVVGYVYNKGYWGSYAPFYSMTAYTIIIGMTLLILSLWYQAPLVIQTHLLALASSFSLVFL